MDDLIKRSDAIKIMACEMYAEAQSQGYEVDSIEDFMPEAKAWMNDAPSADRPQGEWIYCEDYVGHDGYECSNCGFFVPWAYDVYADSNFILNYHTCPYCDARMKEQKITE